MLRAILRLVFVVTIALLSNPSAVLAGGWSIVTLDTVPTDVVAGREVVVGFRVLQHGHMPVTGIAPKLKFTHVASGARTAATAVPEGAAGHYVAKATLVSSGTWEWVIEAFEGDHPMPALNVQAATSAKAAPVTTVNENTVPASLSVERPVTPAATGAPIVPAVMQDIGLLAGQWPVLAGGLALVVLGAFLMWLRLRPRRADRAVAALR